MTPPRTAAERPFSRIPALSSAANGIPLAVQDVAGDIAVAAAAVRRDDPPMKLGRVCTVMAFVTDPNAAARFWSAAVDAPLHAEHPAVTIGNVLLFFHAAEADRNPQGGTVAYFEVDRLDELHEALLLAGCVAHRGPLELADGRRICQVRDPFGTIWGLEESRC